MRGAIITEFGRPVESFSAEKPGSVALLRRKSGPGHGPGRCGEAQGIIVESRMAGRPRAASNWVMMNRFFQLTTGMVLALLLCGCHRQLQTPTVADAPTASPSPVPGGLALVTPPKTGEPILLPGPNAVPRDTRIVVNIPAFRMDVFERGAPIKSYRVGIGYPKYPLPTGLRKIQTIVFNPTWTPPDSPWVDSMKVAPGETIGAGSRLNPLGPIKIPIGLPSLIHGGKPLAKIGTFASHGCVGLTNEQVKDFAQLLVKASNTDLSDDTMSAYLSRRTKTRVVNLNQLVPVELRYETIVLEDGQLHIYRDVYGQNTNTEKNLRSVLEASGISLDNLSEEEKAQALSGLNQMSRYPQRVTKAKVAPRASPAPGNLPANIGPAIPLGGQRKKDPVTNQKEIVIDIAALHGKGYPAPVALNTGDPAMNKNN